ncbi:MAG: hypothetical protein QF755_02560 [Candidatus Peribacteraceae bacterium]|nr:hypothetical protein [Candidatus Peribacteraceae bacterium]
MKNRKHNRRSIRLKYHDYCCGLYFVTICIQQKGWLLGEIDDGALLLNEYGGIVLHRWLEITSHFPNVILDSFVIMPDHVHGIISINHGLDRIGNCVDYVGAHGDLCVGAQRAVPLQIYQRQNNVPLQIYQRQNNVLLQHQNQNNMPLQNQNDVSLRQEHQTREFGTIIPGSLPTIIRSFKSASAKAINELDETPNSKVWQKNYYERKIRNIYELQALRQYIKNNPVNWCYDHEF